MNLISKWQRKNQTKMHRKMKICLVALLTFLTSIAFAQQSVSEEQLRQAQRAGASDSVDLSQYIQSGGNSIGRNQPINVPSSSGPLPAGQEGLPPPYGANLFQGGFESQRSDGLNSSYLVAPGDKISIQMWGTVNRAEVVTVDNQGNIYYRCRTSKGQRRTSQPCQCGCH
jgi:hypothetical protein